MENVEEDEEKWKGKDENEEKWKMEGGKWRNMKNVRGKWNEKSWGLFFFGFSLFWKRLKSHQEKIRKSDFAPPENFSCYAPVVKQEAKIKDHTTK